MRFDLARMWAQAKRPRKRTVAFRQITLPGTLASDLYASAYAEIIRAWSQGVARVMAEYERSLSEITQDAPADISAVLVSLNADAARLMVTIRMRLERWAARVEQAHRTRWQSAVKQGTGLDITHMIGPQDMRIPLGTAIERNVALVQSVSDEARNRISDAVFRGLSQRKPARDVAADIRDAVEMGRKRALNIAADQTSKIAESLNEERRREAGLMAWEWVSSHKTHFRPEHAARDGKRYSDDPADNAPPPEDRPAVLPFCGCTSRAVLSLDSEF